MRRRWTILWGLIAVIAGAFSIIVSTEVQEQENTLDRINRTVAGHHEAINVLRAEWSYMNRPGRLENLSLRHLGLQPVKPEQMMRVSELPFAGREDAPVLAPARRPSMPLHRIARPAPGGLVGVRR